MLTEEKLEEKRKQSDQWWDDNQTQYYGLSIEEVKEVLREYDDLLDIIRTLQQQNKQLVEAVDRLVSIVEPHHPITAADYQIWLQTIKGESHDS